MEAESSAGSLPRYCHHAADLDLRSLYMDEDVRLVINRLHQWHHGPKLKDFDPKGQGALDDYRGLSLPTLPVEVVFLFDREPLSGCGTGVVSKSGYRVDLDDFYRFDVAIFDHDMNLFRQFSRCMEHAALSGMSSVELTLHRREQDDRGEEAEALERIKKQILEAEATSAKLPAISFYGVSFSDVITLGTRRTG